jgi:hypothetical protein
MICTGLVCSAVLALVAVGCARAPRPTAPPKVEVIRAEDLFGGLRDNPLPVIRCDGDCVRCNAHPYDTSWCRR